MQNMPPIADIDSVSRVVSTLISRDAIEALGEDIDDLTLSLVAPLNAYDRKILCP